MLIYAKKDVNELFLGTLFYPSPKKCPLIEFFLLQVIFFFVFTSSFQNLSFFLSTKKVDSTFSAIRRHDRQHNDTQYNDTHHGNSSVSTTLCSGSQLSLLMMLSFVMVSGIMHILTIYAQTGYTECGYTEYQYAESCYV